VCNDNRLVAIFLLLCDKTTATLIVLIEIPFLRTGNTKLFINPVVMGPPVVIDNTALIIIKIQRDEVDEEEDERVENVQKTEPNLTRK
jgi:hypothetical protein